MTLELSEADAALVRALDRYNLLTIEQAERLGIANRKHIGVMAESSRKSTLRV